MFLKTLNVILIILLVTGAVMMKTSNTMAQSQYSLKELTPEVQAALDGRKGRYEDLKALKAQGLVGENNRGYVEALSDDASAKSAVEAENADRRIVYKTIEKQNNLTDAMATIEKVFGQVQRDKAAAGDKVQDESGQWVTK